MTNTLLITPTAAVAAPPAVAALPSAEGLAQAVREVFLAGLGYDPALRSPGEPGIEDVAVFALESAQGMPRTWVAHTVGLRDFGADQPHLLALYQLAGVGSVAEVARLDLNHSPPDESDTIAPDYIGPTSVRQLFVEPAGLWIAIEAGVGAHSGAFELYRYADGALTLALEASNSTPGVAAVADLNGDGLTELLINEGEAYVFCYACGVRIPQIALWRWDGAQLAQVQLQTLPADAPADLAALNDRLIALAQAGLWGDVRHTLDEIVALEESGATLPETMRWNVALARLNEEAKRAPLSAPEPPYRLLDLVFYGDYTGALELFRPHPAAAIFGPASPLILGTVAEGWEESLAGWAGRSADAVLAAAPDLAPAHFVRGWATWLSGDRSGALAALEQAAAISPDEPVYADAVRVLRAQAAAGGAFVAPAALDVYAGPGMDWPTVTTVAADTRFTATGRLEDGAWLQVLYPVASTGLSEAGWVTSVAAETLLLPKEAIDLLPVVTAPALVAPVVERGQIFYSRANGDGLSSIWSVNVVAGAEPLLVISEARQPALQPQGQTLAFASTRPDMLGLGGLDLRTG
ncbi:MAG: SH3 domain-containing protein, partial [Caldilineaceae bacterium]